MLRPSSVRDASTCLRCNLRLVLRQIQPRRYQSSGESPQPSQEFPAPSTPPFDQQQKHQAPRLRIVRHHANHGKIRGRKGSQRRVESAEALSIASLGQDSEVIVLRDLHEPRIETKKTNHPTLDDDFDDLDGAEKTPPPPTASDIENMSAGRRAIRPKDQEVFESIDELRPSPLPESEVLVIKKNEFRARFTALAKGYTIGQLKGYLLQKTAPTRLGSSKAGSSRHVLATEITSSSGELQDLKRTAWHGGTTPITRRLPIVAFSTREGLKMNNKEDVIESILRHVWKLEIDEEKSAIGEMEFLLSPMQFGLLLTKNSRTLQPVLESTKYYSNSRFQLHQPDHVIRIVGPRTEVEAIAGVLTEAYAPAKSADIHLDHFDLALSADRSGYTLQDMLSPAQLTSIMQLTRTYVHYDVTAKRLRIASFAEVAINDAHRLLVALLDTRRRTTVASIYDSHNAEECHLESISTNKDLPSFARFLRLGRWVTSSSKAEQPLADQSPLDIEDGQSITRNDNNMRAGDAGVAHTPLSARSPIMNRAFAIMKTRLDSSEAAVDTKVSIWPERPIYDFWRAHVGLSLHNDGTEATYPGAQGLHVNEQRFARDHRNFFTSKVPGLVGLLASIPPNDPKKEAHVRRTRLLAHLIPSPFEQASTWASTAFPKIQLRFYIEGSSRLRLSEKHVFADLPSGKRIVFQDMRAIIRTEIVQLNLPSHPADIHFKREQRLVSRRVSDDVGIRSFIDAIFESMKNDTVLRAPPALEIPIPQTIVGPMPERYLPQMRDAVRGLKAQVRAASKSGVVPVKYLFAGFEYQEARDFDLGTLAPHHKMDLRSHEAGVTGGRRLDLSLLGKDVKSTEVIEDSKSVERLVNASARLISALAESQVGQPRTRPHLAHSNAVRARETRKTASDSESYSTEMEQRRHDKKKTLRVRGISNTHSLELNIVAEQDNTLELNPDQGRAEGTSLDAPSVEEAITVEKPEAQTRVFDASAGQEHTEQTSSTDASASTPSTIDNDTARQEASTQTSPEPGAQEDKAGEVKAQETKAVEEEPLSVRLQRMMGGGR